MTNVVNQLTFNLKRVYDLGVKKVVVTSLTPMGCLPGNTVRSLFQTCIEEVNQLVGHHNLLLQQGVAKLNTETKKSLMILDLYASFQSVLQNKGDHQGN
jgi:predicted nucleotide-binding protein (sugar kinase/HSP70/actin superfamily)